MLASMFGMEPFKRPQEPYEQQLPFRFVWSNKQCEELPSAFALSETVLPKRPRDEPPPPWRTLALKLDDKYHQITRDKRPWETFGVVVAQRRRTGQVWVVITGVNGPGTLAAARLVHSITNALPDGDIGQHGPVLWAAVRGRVDVAERRRGDPRVLIDQGLLARPRIWHPVN